MVTSKRVLVVGLGLLAMGAVASATDVTGPVSFVGITPCRIIETRAGQGFSGQAGPPALVANATRTFQITGTVPGLPAQCGIPATAVAISVNFTVTNFTGQGDIRVFPAGGTLPLTSILNYQLENIANATTVPLGPGGISVRADAAGTDFIADVNGYYVPRPFNSLESGRTVTGAWGGLVNNAAAGQRTLWTFTFPQNLASAPTPNFIAAGGAPTAACPGSAASPTATAGNLCVYEAGSQNRTLLCPPNGIAKPSVSGGCGTDSFGAGVVVAATAAGEVWSYGTYAVTAP